MEPEADDRRQARRASLEVVDHDRPLPRLLDDVRAFGSPKRDDPEFFGFQENPKLVLFEVAFLERNKLVAPFKTSRPLGMSAVALDRQKGRDGRGGDPRNAFGPTFDRPEPGRDWSFALCCHDDFGPEKTSTVLMNSAPLTKPRFHRFEDFGRLTIEGPPKR